MCCVSRDGKVDQHVTEPAKKNEFLSDLQLLDTGKMETKVLVYFPVLHYSETLDKG